MRIEASVEQERVVGLKFVYREGATPSSPLVVFVHGRAGNRTVMWAFERCVPKDACIVAFEAYVPDPLGGWSWWRMDEVGDTASLEDRIIEAAQRLGEAFRNFKGLFNLTPKRVAACGFSQGGAVLSSALLGGEVELDGLAMLASFIPRAVLPVHRMIGSPEIFIAHGTEDEVVSVEKARQSRDRFRELGLEVEYVEEQVRHKLGTGGMKGLAAWLERVVG